MAQPTNRVFIGGTFAVMLLTIGLVITATGCNTLSSFGLPFGASTNKLLKPAKAISDAPGRSLLLPKELALAPLDVYFVDIGDSILIEPVKFDATIRLPGDQTVQPDGHISLGEFGRVQVAHKTIEQIETEVQAKIDEQLRRDLNIDYEIERRERVEQREFEKRAADRARAKREAESARRDEGEKKNADDSADRFKITELNSGADDDLPLDFANDEEERLALERRINESLTQNQISVRLLNWDSKKIYVLGEVNSPGSFTFLGNETVLDAIIEAGGINTKANRHQIIVSRPSTCSSCRTVMKVCYDQLVQLGDASTNYQLQPGDRVFVPALTFGDDLRITLGIDKNDRCPRCADCPRGCQQATGCE